MQILPQFISENDKEYIIQEYNTHGSDWIGMDHHFWGMACRNFFRENGLKDELLPDGNWDDYYMQVVEKYVGVR